MVYYHTMKQEDCIFCKIVSGEVVGPKVYEDEHSYAFLDFKPISEGHTLVIPKEHHAYIEDMPDDAYSKMMLTVKKLKKAYKKMFNVPQVGFFVSGWDVPHAHVHVVPMHNSKDITSKPQLDGTTPQFTSEEFRVTAETIAREL
jgi:histidine triad (HIT) family protein